AYPLSERAEWQDIEDGGNFSFTFPKYNNQYVISYMGTRIKDEGNQYYLNNFMYTNNVFFSDRFHKVVAQGYGDKLMDGDGKVSAVRKLVYGDFIDKDADGLHGMQKTPYQEGQTLELYIATIVEDTFLSEADFVEKELTIQRPASIASLIDLFKDNINKYTYLSFATFKNETINNKADMNWEKVFLYKYDSIDSVNGEYLKNNGEYLNIINELDIKDLDPGKYEVVIPIYWQEMVPETLSAPDTFSRNRYKIDDTIHFTLIVENPLEMEVNAEGYTGVYDGEAHGITVNAPEGATVTYDVENSLTNIGEVTVPYTVTQEGYTTVTGSAVIKITPRPIAITAASASKTYDGTPLIKDAYTYTPEGTDEGLLESLGHEIQDVTVTGSQITVGSSPNVATGGSIVAPADNQLPMLMSDEGRQFEDITYNYSITYVDGLLTVNRRSGGGGGGGTITIPEEEVPAGLIPGPIIIPEEEVPAGLIPDHIAYITGYPENIVKPESNITREEVAAVFFRLLEPTYKETIRAATSDFFDVGSSRWSTKHIGTLATGNILEGYLDGSFRPGNPITRAELAVIASKFDNLVPTTSSLFTDTTGHWAERYINSAQMKGWVTGYPDGTFKPDQLITRAEFVTLVNNVLQRRVHTENILPEARQFPDLVKGKWYYEAMQEAINSHLYERMEDTYEKWTEIYWPIIEM
ncbi:MAG: S-layer homology domain-containing protein, partial [Bacteroidales bacterium]|nr:S-layer homology domain-containing protein [Bacteroidales bacterium]